MAITFSEIPVDLRIPGAFVEVDNSLAVRGLPGMPSRILVLGQKFTGGSAPNDTLVQVTDARHAEGLFGRGSMLHRMFVALKAHNTFTETWAIPMADDAAGVAAVGSITFGGSVTIAGTLSLYIAGRRVRVAVGAAQANTTTATAVTNAINAVTDLPVTAAVDGSVASKVNITARHKGENGNTIDIRANYHQGESLPKGLTVTIGAMTGGSGNPDAAIAVANMGDTWWTDLVLPWSDGANHSTIAAEGARRYGAMVARDMHVWSAHAATHAGLVTFASGKNTPHITTLGIEKPLSPPEEWAAGYGAIGAFQARQDPARPLQHLPFRSDILVPPARGDLFTAEERNLLYFGKIASIYVDDAGRAVLERAITMYKTTPLGVDDPSYLDTETLKTIAFIRYQVRARMLLRFPRHKLAGDGARFGAGQNVITPRVARGELIALFREIEDQGLIENLGQFITDLVVERDANDPNRLNAILPPDLVNQFRLFAGKLQFIL